MLCYLLSYLVNIVKSIRRFAFQHCEWLLVIFLLLSSGCTPKNATTYSGEFSVRSKFPKTIRIVDWKNFGTAQPSRGWIVSDSKSDSSFPRLQKVPARTIVEWWVEGDEHSVLTQELDLRGVIPKGKDGITVFEFSFDGKWTVRFEGR